MSTWNPTGRGDGSHHPTGMAGSGERTKVEFDAAGIPVKRWTYTESGLTVCLVRKAGPLVHGFLVLATEAHDDDGLPHTLEHLIFLGSEDYPYKGVLDTLANRCFARGTNAWTATDHTCYTASHAGADGFLTLLPVYLDHILYPTITKAGYHTEVYHVTGAAEDAGVVYCEMQARENTVYSLTEYELQQLMHPGHDGYKSETGGRMENLRTSCSHQKVKDYHTAFYRPDGCCLVVVGDVEEADLHQALLPSLEKFKAKGALPAKQRAWARPARPLGESQDRTVLFPSDDEDTGAVRVAWSCALYGDQEFMSNLAVSILLTYLTDTSVADLQKAMVECDDPLATDIYCHVEDFNPAQASLTFVSVPTGKLEEVKPLLFKVLREVADGTVPFQLPRMQSVITRLLLSCKEKAENCPEDLFLDICIPSFLYDPDASKLQAAFAQLERIEWLLQQEAGYWTGLVRRVLLDPPCTVVVGRPSAAKGKANEAAEQARVDARKAALGPQGMEAAAAALEAAQEENDRPFPDSVLQAFPLPSVDRLSFHPITSTRSSGELLGDRAGSHLTAAEVAQLQAVPFSLQVDEIESEFVTLRLGLRTEGLPESQRLLLPLLMALLLESPVQRPEGLVDWEDIVQELADTTLETDATVGFGGGLFSAGDFPQLAFVEAQCEAERYGATVRLLADCAFRSVPTAERVKVQATKALNAVPSCKRNGGQIAGTLLMEDVVLPEHNTVASNFLRQSAFLAALLERLQAQPQQVCAEVAGLQRALLGDPARLVVEVAGAAHHLRKAPGGFLGPFLQAFLPAQAALAASMPPAAAPGLPLPPPAAAPGAPPPPPPPAPLAPGLCQPTASLLQPHFLGKARVCAVSSVESGFLRQVSAGLPGGLAASLHPDLAAIQVFINYLTCLEGPFWKQIRGAGLSYSYSMSVSPEEGLMHFSLFKSTNLMAAYSAAEAIVRGYADGTTPLTPVELETAISTSVYAIVAREATPGDAALQAFKHSLRGVPAAYHRHMIEAVRAVTIADCRRVLQDYFLPLFDPPSSSLAICCNPVKLQDVLDGFKAKGRHLVQVAELEGDAAGLKGKDREACDCMKCAVPSFLMK